MIKLGIVRGRDKFHEYMITSGFTPKGKFYFPIDNAYTGDYTPIHSTGIIYDCSSLKISCDIMNSVRKTVFFYYRKDA